MEVTMGDKSPKTKERQQRQKAASKEQHAAAAKAKQTAQGSVKEKK
jgi:hypothetical protein